MYLVQPEKMMETVKQRIKNRNPNELAAEVAKVNQGILFQNHVNRVQSLLYYKEKYDIDHQIKVYAGQLQEERTIPELSTVSEEDKKTDRKRDIKRDLKMI